MDSAPLAFAIAAGLASLGGCGGGNDQPSDAPGTTIDAGPCGADAVFTGELIDWESTGIGFCGVFNATVTVRDQPAHPAQTDKTSPNGRFELCAAHKDLVVADVVPSADASQCPNRTTAYPTQAVLLAERAVIEGGTAILLSARMMTAETKAKVYDPTGTVGAYNPAQAQLIIHLVGPARAVTIGTPNHSHPLQFDGTTWTASAAADIATGTDVLFPNIADPTLAPVAITVAGVTGTRTVSVTADKFTYLTVITQ
jgi:hypothetical protein